MNLEELLVSKDYVWIGKCCGGWNKWTPKSNLGENNKPIDGLKIIRIRGKGIKIFEGGRFWIKPLTALGNYL